MPLNRGIITVNACHFDVRANGYLVLLRVSYAFDKKRKVCRIRRYARASRSQDSWITANGCPLDLCAEVKSNVVVVVRVVVLWVLFAIYRIKLWGQRTLTS